jgi:hypothetical protein
VDVALRADLADAAGSPIHLGAGQFNTLITGFDAPTDDRSIILPAILIGGIIRLLVNL